MSMYKAETAYLLLASGQSLDLSKERKLSKHGNTTRARAIDDHEHDAPRAEAASNRRYYTTNLLCER